MGIENSIEYVNWMIGKGVVFLRSFEAKKQDFEAATFLCLLLISIDKSFLNLFFRLGKFVLNKQQTPSFLEMFSII